MSTIIVTGVGGDIGLPVARILAESGHRVVGVDAGDATHARAFLDTVEAVPLASDPDHLAALAEIARRHRADVVAPCIEPELPLWTPAQRQAFPARVMAVAPPLVAVLSDKLATAQWLRARGLGAPVSLAVADIARLAPPVIVKRRRGSGGRGLQRLDDRTGFAAAAALGEDYFAQEAVGDDDGELTCGVFRAHGHCRVLQIRRYLAGGITHRGEVVADARVDALCRAIAEALDLFGSVNVQLRLGATGPQVFEINPRFSSTVLFRHLLGFADVIWWLAALDGVPPPDYTAPVGARIRRAGLEVVTMPGQPPKHFFS